MTHPKRTSTSQAISSTSLAQTRRCCLAVALLGASLMGGAAWAQSPTPSTGERQEARVDKRQERQDTRVDQGVASGDITRREQARLTHQQNRIARLEKRVEADGQVTRQEALRIEKSQDRAGRRIAHARNDRQSRPSAN